MSSERTDASPPQIDGYRILRVIGHGGMSTVYLAEQVSLSRKVALKVMLPEALADEVSRGRFENEARTIARLQHPHIVSIHEVGRTSGGLPFYSMPHLPRGHLAQRDLRGDQPQVAAILRPLLQALDYAHVRGVVHRDVKAENVLFDENERPQLADFGIALRRGSNPRLTSTGLAVGSTAYMPPEQARGSEVDRRADLYSLGVLAWEMLTGRLPYNAGDALSMAMMHTQDPIPRLPPLLRHWQGFIDKALAKKPDQRFSSANDMLAALDELERRSGRAFGRVEVPAYALSGTVKPSEPRAGWKPMAMALGALLAAGAGFALWTGGGPDTGSATPQQASARIDDIPGDALPAPQPGAQTGVLADIDAPAEPGAGAAYLANAEQQLRAGHLLAPANANAWDSWDAAWRIDSTAPQVQMLTARLFDALADASDLALRAGNIASAREAFRRAQQLDARRGGDGSAIALLRTRLHATLETRMADLVAKPDRTGAQRLLADTAWLELGAARSSALRGKLAALERAAPASMPSTPTSVATRNANVITVSRAEYARFAAATSRRSAECGRSSLFGSRRSWSSPGDRQGAGAPVVCVSAGDAQAYAAWRSAQENSRYRLPSSGELKAQPTTPVSGWLTLCADRACNRRMASGQARPLDSARGYNNIGIRLVRER
ncbi:MAG: bifunctional serine/threonine-protein kinase/formylglycine-generating enzyme family protein [Pseudomonadota bacterium]